MKRWLLAVLLLVFLLVFLLVGVSAGWLYQQLHQPLKLQEARVWQVPAGSSFLKVLRDLEQAELLDSALAMRVWLKLSGETAAIHSGEYRLQPGLSSWQLLQLLKTGRVITYRVTLPEGWTFQRIRQQLAEQEGLVPQTRDWSEADIMQALGQPDMPAEGWFLPETYTYTRGMNDLDVLRQAHQAMQQALQTVWAERASGLPYANPYELLIMASLVERETGVAYEQPDIAGVFVRRLQQRMRLQTDPTVIYGMGDAYQGRITRRDLQTATPWNTYRIDGLPPTPIASPGIGALRAAAHPADGSTLYFVARGDGTHHFSATLEEHNQAVRTYQLNRRADYRSWPAPASQEEESDE